MFQAPIMQRKQKLSEAMTLQQFLRDIEDEEDWIREKEPIASSTNRGKQIVLSFTYFTPFVEFFIN